MNRIAYLSLVALLGCAGSPAKQPSTVAETIATAADSPAETYAQNCAGCHGAGRFGGSGPALIPESLNRLRKEEAQRVIANGRTATQMPGFAGKLSPAEIADLSAYLYEPPESAPVWEASDILNSRRELTPPVELQERRTHKADPMNLFVVVETGDHHATILDGGTFEPLSRFQTHFALHGGPKFSPDGRHVFFASRDGWITKYDLWNLKPVVEIRAGINTRNVAVSGDGSLLLVGNYLPATLVLLSAKDFSLKKVIPVADAAGTPSRVSAVYQAKPRGSFLVALKDAKELWEIKPGSHDMSSRWVHDHRPESGDMHAVADKFDIRRVATQTPLDDFSFDPSYRYLLGSSRSSKGMHVIDLDAGETIARIPIEGMPHLASGVTWEYQGKTVMATPNLQRGTITVISLADWKVIREIPTPGAGFFLRTHEKTPYAWTDTFLGASKDQMVIIDKRTLEVVKLLQPVPGKTSAHTEFTRDGKYALVSVWDMDGELIVYDAETLAVVKRLPMRKPSGKYNVFNKISLDAGTSH
jgi:mono/diheme cytochrome c family protein